MNIPSKLLVLKYVSPDLINSNCDFFIYRFLIRVFLILNSNYFLFQH
jgi:hypothetical protein